MLIDKELEIIKNQFKDDRSLNYVEQENLGVKNPNGDVFLTEDGTEIILFNIHMTSFTAKDLTYNVNIAEEFYEYYHKKVNIYILMFNNEVLVKECSIKSEADFTIRLAVGSEDPCRMLFDNIKNRFEEDGKLNESDVEVLEMLPLLCHASERDFYREEYFKIMSMVEA